MINLLCMLINSSLNIIKVKLYPFNLFDKLKFSFETYNFMKNKFYCIFDLLLKLKVD
jgi:hypothetical protein